MFLGYNTNGFAHHRLPDAIKILAELGYAGVALTVDVHALDVFAKNHARERDEIAELLTFYRLTNVIETGARFLLDPRRKHQPTLLDSFAVPRAKRSDFLKRCIELAAVLKSEAISFWSGTPVESAPDEVLMDRLVDELQPLCEFAASHQVRLAFEPEPGMFIDTMTKFRELHDRVSRPNFGLTLDVGHLQCLGELPASEHIKAWKDRLWNVHIEDMKSGVHDHLMFGEGDMDFADIFAALREINYSGGVFVELSRHSHNAVETARKSLAFLSNL
ncbi:sugar phosphate isomerase/epimerase family protein [Zavarzinella formosa]|uniref:sugar phosphate isomerase/epimerase family protein n=1 Tax=Zavarzinella formosa TaxID=360055 RepID=UPI0002D3F23F|nr:sugar phosphate isomerase/epimerase family protein [Zavarzinella formosa]